jgi:hypothetical protein
MQPASLMYVQVENACNAVVRQGFDRDNYFKHYALTRPTRSSCEARRAVAQSYLVKVDVLV